MMAGFCWVNWPCSQTHKPQYIRWHSVNWVSREISFQQTQDIVRKLLRIPTCQEYCMERMKATKHLIEN